MRNASTTTLACMCSLMHHPTTWRLNRSMTAVRYSQPSSVAMYVMSLVHTRFGAGAVKFLIWMPPG